MQTIASAGMRYADFSGQILEGGRNLAAQVQRKDE